jgi:hypothetical protein
MAEGKYMKTKLQTNPAQRSGMDRQGLMAQLLNIAAHLAWNAV